MRLNLKNFFMENNVVIYQSSDGLVKMEAIVDASNETIWATQNISYHFKRIFASGELDAQTVIKEILITAQSGVRGVSEEKSSTITWMQSFHLDIG